MVGWATEARSSNRNEHASYAPRAGRTKSSVSLWCRDSPVDEATWSARARANRNEGARNRRPNKLQLAKQEQIEECRRQAAALIGALSERELLVAGTALYAGEGGKGDHSVTFSNSDPRMVALFMLWFRQFFDIDESRLRVPLYLHEGLDLDLATTMWSQVTGIPVEQFTQPYRAVADPSIRKAKHVHGCATVVYNSTIVHRLVMGMVDAVLSATSFRGSSVGRAADC